MIFGLVNEREREKRLVSEEKLSGFANGYDSIAGNKISRIRSNRLLRHYIDFIHFAQNEGIPVFCRVLPSRLLVELYDSSIVHGFCLDLIKPILSLGVLLGWVRMGILLISESKPPIAQL